MNIAIIGAGWVGCHLAKILKETGFDIALFINYYSERVCYKNNTVS
jgi:Trk K+ transport system NAD-binding subunit